LQRSEKTTERVGREGGLAIGFAKKPKRSSPKSEGIEGEKEKSEEEGREKPKAKGGYRKSYYPQVRRKEQKTGVQDSRRNRFRSRETAEKESKNTFVGVSVGGRSRERGKTSEKETK